MIASIVSFDDFLELATKYAIIRLYAVNQYADRLRLYALAKNDDDVFIFEIYLTEDDDETLEKMTQRLEKHGFFEADEIMGV